MKVSQQGNTVILEDIKHFNPKHIFECGQCLDGLNKKMTHTQVWQWAK